MRRFAVFWPRRPVATALAIFAGANIFLLDDGTNSGA